MRTHTAPERLAAVTEPERRLLQYSPTWVPTLLPVAGGRNMVGMTKGSVAVIGRDDAHVRLDTYRSVGTVRTGTHPRSIHG